LWVRQNLQHKQMEDLTDSTKVATVTTLKTSIGDTLSFVNYHLNSGIYHMYLFFDDPEDRSISHLKNNDRLSLIKCDSDHWKNLNTDPKLGLQIKQRANANLALELAQKAGINWLIHLDVDELLYGNERLPIYLGKIHQDIDVLRFPVLEATPQKMYYDDPIREIKFFKFYGALPSKLKNFNTREADAKKQMKAAWIWNQKRRLAKLLGCSSVKGSKFLYGHQNGKSAIRVGTKVETVGTHFPIPEDENIPNISVSEDFFLLHYDCLGLNRWKRKWEKRFSGENFHNPAEHSRQRLDLMSQIEKAVKNDESIRKLYQDLYYLSRYEMTLLPTLGLVRRIQLPGELFDN
jgi:hypothetical protein